MAPLAFPRWGTNGPGGAIQSEDKARHVPHEASPPTAVNPGGPMQTPSGILGAYNLNTGQIGPDNPHGPYPSMTGPYWHPTSRANWQHIFWGDW